MVTGQLADKPTRGQSSRKLVNSRTSQLAKMLDLKFGVYNSFGLRISGHVKHRNHFEYI